MTPRRVFKLFGINARSVAAREKAAKFNAWNCARAYRNFSDQMIFEEFAHVLGRSEIAKSPFYYMEAVRRRCEDRAHEQLKNHPHAAELQDLIESVTEKRKERNNASDRL